MDILERSDDIFLAQAELEPGEIMPIPVEMTSDEVEEFETEHVIWNQKFGVPGNRTIILEVEIIGTVRGKTYREAIGIAKALFDRVNS